MRPQEWYNNNLSETKQNLNKVNKTILYISIIRILLFVGCISTVIALWSYSAQTIIIGACCTLIPFLIMIKVHNRFFLRRQWLEVKADILGKELKGLDNDYSEFDEGKEFADTEHLYSFDLDIFGRKSLFQAINRTCTHIGKTTLADWMENHLRKKEDIEERQECIKDLSERNDFRLKFAITGLINRSENSDDSDIRKWAETESSLTKSTWAKALIWLVPSVNIILLACGLADIISMSWFGLAFSVFVILSFSVIKRATALQEEYGKKLKTLSTYARLITLAQNEEWNAKGMELLLRSGYKKQ